MKDSRVVVITGASAGIGRATARAFAARGARLGLIARNAEALENARNEVEARGGEAVVAIADVDGVVYRVSGTETVAGGRARRRATPGKGMHSRVAPRQWCGELSTKRADARIVCFDSPHRLRGAISNTFWSVGSASARATHGYPLGTAKRGTRHRGSVRSRLLRPKNVQTPVPPTAAPVRIAAVGARG